MNREIIILSLLLAGCAQAKSSEEVDTLAATRSMLEDLRDDLSRSPEIEPTIQELLEKDSLDPYEKSLLDELVDIQKELERSRQQAS